MRRAACYRGGCGEYKFRRSMRCRREATAGISEVGGNAGGGLTASHGWARISRTVSRFLGSGTRIFLIKSFAAHRRSQWTWSHGTGQHTGTTHDACTLRQKPLASIERNQLRGQLWEKLTSFADVRPFAVREGEAGTQHELQEIIGVVRVERQRATQPTWSRSKLVPTQ